MTSSTAGLIRRGVRLLESLKPPGSIGISLSDHDGS